MTPDEKELNKKIDARATKLYNDFFDSNYSSGAPRIPPHTHNGIDNLPIDPSNFSVDGEPNEVVFIDSSGHLAGDPAFTYDPTTTTLTIPTIVSSVDNNNTYDLTIESNFGTNLFLGSLTDPDNDGFSGTVDIFTDDTNPATGTSGDINIHTGDGDGIGNINITTHDGGTNGGDINIETGGFASASQGKLTIFSNGNAEISASGTASSGMNVFGTGFARFGSTSSSARIDASTLLTVEAGDQVLIQSNNTDGTVDITTSSGISVNQDSGDTNISTGEATGSGDSGDINIITGNVNAGGGSGDRGIVNIIGGGGAGSGHGVIIEGNTFTGSSNGIALQSNGSINFLLAGQISNTLGSNIFVYTGAGSPALADGKGVIFIENAFTDPTTATTGGGALYVSGGALKYIGSGGTITTIAPA